MRTRTLRSAFWRAPAEAPEAPGRPGMDAACERLHAVGRPHGLIASTDADTRVAPDWLARQLEFARGGARAIGGRIELCPVEREALHQSVVAGHRAQSLNSLRARPSRSFPTTDRWPTTGSSAEHRWP